MKKRGEGKNMEASLDERYNVSDTKKYYSKINETVLAGLIVTTFNAFKDEKNSQVSHIRKDILEHLALQSSKYDIAKTFDNELNVWTVAVNEINLYGEGNTENEAVEDLIDSVIEYASLYKEKSDLFCKVESLDKLVFFIRILLCQGDREKIKKLLGV
ncbi:MAG: hypothetical protein Q7J85_10045 [Bacillota bacterium]|nr:hypothetical protein [Bacillota bacterium]